MNTLTPVRISLRTVSRKVDEAEFVRICGGGGPQSSLSLKGDAPWPVRDRSSGTRHRDSVSAKPDPRNTAEPGFRADSKNGSYVSEISWGQNAKTPKAAVDLLWR